MEIKKWLGRTVRLAGVAGAIVGGAAVGERISSQEARIHDLENRVKLTGARHEAQKELDYLLVRNVCRVTLLLGNTEDCDTLAAGVVTEMENRAQRSFQGEIDEPIFIDPNAN